ncbi:unnamed protein product [Paramecium primaurelia]|uniref:CCAAT-binding factor domain-containing protein n=1 Tax=Paramecium primaurelia TaxID=5886 RepID=A0A8S1K244_PARPR|nr:unnamed protein product [Paramecium primaurelia]
MVKKIEDSFNHAQKLYEYQEKKIRRDKPASDTQLMQKLLHSGTIADKISALSISIKENPDHALGSLNKLLEIAALPSREKSLKALFQLKDLLIHLILKRGVPCNFEESNLTDELQKYYWHGINQVLVKTCEILIKASQDVLPYVRRQIILMMLELHCAHPIYTKELIKEIVNKFGDKEKTLVTLLTKKLSGELSKKPALTYPFLKETYGFMYRPNLPQEAQYYCLNFINTINLQTQETSTVAYMLKIFFIFFKKIMKIPQADQKCSKLFSQILKGINKTLPYGQSFLDQLKELFKENEKLIYKLIATSENFKIKIQTLYFVYQISDLNAHFYRSLYEILLSQEIQSTSLGELFFDLLFLSIKQDNEIVRQKAIIKRLLQISMHSNLAFTITALICVQKLCIEIPQLLEETNENQEYLYFKRDPLFSGASSFLNEIQSFTSHYHNKAQQIAKQILNKDQNITQKVNPLLEYSQSAFLAKFVEAKNRVTNRISNLSGSVINEEQFKLKFEKQRKQDNQLKQQNKPQRKSSITSEDAYADELFEKELQKGNFSDEDELDLSMDQDDDDLVDLSEDETQNENQQKQIPIIMRKIYKRHKLLKK